VLINFSETSDQKVVTIEPFPIIFYHPVTKNIPYSIHLLII